MNSHSRKTTARRHRIQAGRAAVAEARRLIDAEAQARYRDEWAWVEKIGAPAFASVSDLVAALSLDWKRLAELRDDRDAFTIDEDENAAPGGPGYANDAEAWAGENPDDAEELAELEKAAGDVADQDEARERIQDDALSAQVRSGWADPGADLTAEEFELLLTTGGPAVRIVGELNGHKEAASARMEVQDWGKPWTEYLAADADTLLTYAGAFFFGE